MNKDVSEIVEQHRQNTIMDLIFIRKRVPSGPGDSSLLLLPLQPTS